MKTSIIIPLYNRWDLCHNRLYEIYQKVPLNDLEVVIVDDCSPEESEIKGGMAWWQKTFGQFPIRYYRNKENRGFGGTCNNGAKLATGGILAFLSTDVQVMGDFLSPIRAILSERPDVLIGGEVIDFNGGWNEVKFNGKPMYVPYCNGWLLACTKDNWEKMGGFDKRYGRFDFEDVDLSTTAQLLGLGLVALPESKRLVRHQGAQTISTLNVNRLEQTKKNQLLWQEKWAKKWSEIFDGVR